jgi:hypothetical protein
LCTTAKRDSFYDDLPESFNKTNEQQSADQYGFIRLGKFFVVVSLVNILSLIIILFLTISINRLVDNICVYLDKPRRLIRQANMDESDGEDDMNITEKLRRASSNSPANIPMLVVVSFNPDVKGLQKKQIEIHRGKLIITKEEVLSH